MDTHWTEFKVGSRVIYTGSFSPSRKGMVGTVVAKKPPNVSLINDTSNSPTNINVVWDDGEEYLGVFPESITLIGKKPRWEL